MLQEAIFLYIVIVISAVFHEYAHAWMARRLGDTTAEQMGRLTLNPIAHIDPIGTVLLPLLLLFTPALIGGQGVFIGWAKPVPYNPYNLQDQRYGNLKVAIAGPITNMLIAIILGLLVRFSSSFTFLSAEMVSLLVFIVLINIYLAIFNMIPVPPLDGSKVLADLFPSSQNLMNAVGPFGIIIALFAAFYILGPLASLILKLIIGFPAF